jgi:hypothetical protein
MKATPTGNKVKCDSAVTFWIYMDDGKELANVLIAESLAVQIIWSAIHACCTFYLFVSSFMMSCIWIVSGGAMLIKVSNACPL